MTKLRIVNLTLKRLITSSDRPINGIQHIDFLIFDFGTNLVHSTYQKKKRRHTFQTGEGKDKLHH